MKNQIFRLGLIGLFLASFTSCIIVTDHPGPAGRAGAAFFGVDYDYYSPYSYWDNNQSISNNPNLGMYYPTNAGLFDFEYFINPYEYWYGTYEIYRNSGGPGLPHGEAGYDGSDSYLLMIINPEGFYEVRGNSRMSNPDENTTVVESMDPKKPFKITMTKTNINERPTANQPKFFGGK
jgi:hypothetical protein